MLDCFSHNATVAKAKAMHGKRLTPNDYRELMNRRTVAEAADYLKKNTHFRKALASIDVSNVHRGRLEDILQREFLIDMQHFANSSS